MLSTTNGNERSTIRKTQFSMQFLLKDILQINYTESFLPFSQKEKTHSFLFSQAYIHTVLFQNCSLLLSCIPRSCSRLICFLITNASAKEGSSFSCPPVSNIKSVFICNTSHNAKKYIHRKRII